MAFFSLFTSGIRADPDCPDQPFGTTEPEPESSPASSVSSS